jgi:hypothetical protein
MEGRQDLADGRLLVVHQAGGGVPVSQWTVDAPRALGGERRLSSLDHRRRDRRARHAADFATANNDPGAANWYLKKADGADYNGIGVGRLWPLLTGGHYELAAANASGVDAAIATMEKFANEGRMLPEQVWDANPPTGEASGEGTRSATPLAWSHAEYIRLLRSKADGKIIDTSQVVADRYKDQ